MKKETIKYISILALAVSLGMFIGYVSSVLSKTN